jgi:hypothetical protein
MVTSCANTFDEAHFGMLDLDMGFFAEVTFHMVEKFMKLK